MRQSRTYGSVGTLGEQSPRVTRPSYSVFQTWVVDSLLSPSSCSCHSRKKNREPTSGNEVGHPALSGLIVGLLRLQNRVPKVTGLCIGARYGLVTRFFPSDQVGA